MISPFTIARSSLIARIFPGIIAVRIGLPNRRTTLDAPMAALMKPAADGAT
jgi:hypothetical protein